METSNKVKETFIYIHILNRSNKLVNIEESFRLTAIRLRASAGIQIFSSKEEDKRQSFYSIIV